MTQYHAINTSAGRVESVACPGFWIGVDWPWEKPDIVETRRARGLIP